MIWRMLPARFNRLHVHNQSPFPLIEKKFETLLEDYNSFFGIDENVQTAETLSKECVDSVMELLPAFFTELLEVAPRRRIADLLIYGSVRIPFTESEILMHLVSLRFCVRYNKYIFSLGLKKSPLTL